MTPVMHLTGTGAISPFSFFWALGQFPIVTAGDVQVHANQQQQIQLSESLAVQRKCGRLEWILTRFCISMRTAASSRTRGMQMGYITLCVRAGDVTSNYPPWQPDTEHLGKPWGGQRQQTRVAQGSVFTEAGPKERNHLVGVGMWLGPKLSHVSECDTGRKKQTPTKLKENI